MHVWLGGWIQVAVGAVQAVVKFPGGRIRGDDVPRERPISFRRDQLSADGGHQRIAVAGADCLFRYRLLSAGHVTDDLSPQSTLSAAAHRDQPTHGGEVTIEEFKDLPDAEGDAFVNGPEQV